MKKWNIRQSDKTQQNILGEALGVSPIIAQLLINRGIENIDEAKSFLRGDISELYDPFLMKGMREAVERLKQAVEKKEKVFIHGDYDVDGITSIALLMIILRKFGIEPDYYVPDRLTEGYGLSEAGVKAAIEKGVNVLLTVDCGIKSYEEVVTLNKHNIDVIITDHHEVGRILPPAAAVINPLQKDCAYPDKNLSGVSVAFKLCEALCSVFHSKDAWNYLDLVMLGTISDVAPLVGENRIFVKEGFKMLNNGASNKGIRALIEASSLKDKELRSFEVSFILGPRINAAGRLGSAETAVELLLTEDIGEANVLAKKLNDANRARQKIEASTLKEALSKVEREINFKDHKIIVLDSEDWHTGVIGIVASRISDRFYRPTILISKKDGIGRGSGRSIKNFHLFEALMSCEDILKTYGGHKYACGLTILEKNLELFKKTINDIASDVLIPSDMVPHIDIEMDLPLNSLDDEIIEDINKLQPFGAKNPEPLFCSRGLKLTRPIRVLKNEHIKMWVTDGIKDFEAIGFGLAKDDDIETILKKCPKIDLAYTASFNIWQGIRSIQLKIKDIKPFESSQP